MNRSTRGMLALFSLVILAAGCGPAAQQQGDLSGRPVNAVATTGMIGDLVAGIGGDRVQVTFEVRPSGKEI